MPLRQTKALAFENRHACGIDKLKEVTNSSTTKRSVRGPIWKYRGLKRETSRLRLRPDGKCSASVSQNWVRECLMCAQAKRSGHVMRPAANQPRASMRLRDMKRRVTLGAHTAREEGGSTSPGATEDAAIGCRLGAKRPTFSGVRRTSGAKAQCICPVLPKPKRHTQSAILPNMVLSDTHGRLLARRVCGLLRLWLQTER